MVPISGVFGEEMVQCNGTVKSLVVNCYFNLHTMLINSVKLSIQMLFSASIDSSHSLLLCSTAEGESSKSAAGELCGG